MAALRASATHLAIGVPLSPRCPPHAGSPTHMARLPRTADVASAFPHRRRAAVATVNALLTARDAKLQCPWQSHPNSSPCVIAAQAAMQATRVELDVPVNAEPRRHKELILYTHMLCPYAQRVLLTLLEKEADFEMVHIDLSSKPGWFSHVNPRGLVPAVEFTDTGRVEVESIDLCRLLDSELPGPALSPEKGSEAYSRMERIIASTSGIVSAGLGMAAGSDGRFWGIGRRANAGKLKRYEAALSEVETALRHSGGPFLLGEQITIADLILMPFLERFDLIGRHFHGFDTRAARGGAVGSWLEAMEGRPSCRSAAASPQELLAAYKRHMSLDFFDYETYGATSLHPHNRKQG